MSDAENPFATPQAAELEAGPPPGSKESFEAMRNEHLKHEASVRSIGSLYILSGIGLVLGALASGLGGEQLLASALMLLFAGLMFTLGILIHRLDHRVRWPTAGLAMIGLLGFPFGTLINGYILYLLLAPKGKTVFSPEYREIMEQTPHIRYRTSPVVIVIGLLFIALLVAGMIAASFSQ